MDLLLLLLCDFDSLSIHPPSPPSPSRQASRSASRLFGSSPRAIPNMRLPIWTLYYISGPPSRPASFSYERRSTDSHRFSESAPPTSLSAVSGLDDLLVGSSIARHHPRQFAEVNVSLIVSTLSSLSSALRPHGSDRPRSCFVTMPVKLWSPRSKNESG